MSIDNLFTEAARQLNVCNSCRYCAGYCPVWPALELRTTLTKGDITHLANLCHDCRDCFSACMYTAPHEFALDPPRVFSEVREETYRAYLWPKPRAGGAAGWRGVALALVVVAAVLVALSLLTSGVAGLSDHGSGSPYNVISHWVLVGIALAPALWTVIVLARALVLYWRDTTAGTVSLWRPAAWRATLSQAARLAHQSGGASPGCDYPDETPAGARRRWHHFVSYGFGLTFIATVAAAAEEDIFGIDPPYSWISVPVLTGTVGGVSMIVGSVALLVLKRRSSPDRIGTLMRRADVAFLWALIGLSASGLLTLLLRHTDALGAVLVVHLALVLVAIAIAPYTKFVHFLYRILAIYRHNVESA